MADTMLPAALVVAGQRLPSVCSRHGKPATGSLRVRFISRPPGWSYLLLVLGAVPFVIVAMALRKTVDARTWPICDECRSRRRTALTAGFGMLGGWLSLMVIGLALPGGSGSATDAGTTSSGGSDLGPALVMIAFVLLVAGILVAARGGPVPLAGGVVIADGAWVRFRKPASAFAEQVAAIVATTPAPGAPGYAPYGPGRPVAGQPAYGQPPYPAQPYGQPPYGQPYGAGVEPPR